MSALVELYLEEVANGTVPTPGSPEAVAYSEWSAREEEYERMARLVLRGIVRKVRRSI
jgi:hypothetical protein